MGSLKVCLLAILLGLPACVTTPTGTANSWCASHDLEDYRRTAEERAAETPAERRVRLNDLTYGAANCGWRP